MYKNYGIAGLFLLLVATLIVKPRVFYNLYNHILGRVLLIGVVIFFTLCNVTLGLLAALCLIVASNMFLIEGLDNLHSSTGTTIGDDNALTSSDAKLTVTTKAESKDKDGQKINELDAQGVDRQTIHETIQAKSSKIFNSEDVKPSETSSTVVEGIINKYAKF